MKKSKKLAKISTAVIGIYLLFLVVIGVKTALLCHDFSKIGMIGIDLSARAKNLDDYISGYAMVPGAFFTLLGSSFGGVIFFLLMFAIVFACVVLLVHIVISCILIRKEKLRTDAMLKLVMAIVGLLFSVILLKSVRKQKRRMLVLLPVFLLVLLTGCGKLGAIVNDIHGSLIGNNYTVYTYDNYGNQTLKTSGKKISITGNKIETTSYDDYGRTVTGYDFNVVNLSPEH